MMCRVCSGRFEPEELHRVREAFPYGEGKEEQVTGTICPLCGAEEVYDECSCCECGEELPPAELEDGLCRFCVADLTQTLEWMWGMLTPAQQRWACEHGDWMTV